MRFSSVTVYVDYRMLAGDEHPRWKALRARVRQGNLYGSDLTRQGIQDPDQIKIEAINRLIRDGIETDRIVFEFAPLLAQKGMRDCAYHVAGGKVTLAKSA